MYLLFDCCMANNCKGFCAAFLITDNLSQWRKVERNCLLRNYSTGHLINFSLGTFLQCRPFLYGFDVLKLACIKIQKSTESQLILSVANIVENVFAERKERVYAGGGNILKRTDLFTAHFPFATLGCC